MLMITPANYAKGIKKSMRTEAPEYAPEQFSLSFFVQKIVYFFKL
jgi:hypothetical protein